MRFAGKVALVTGGRSGIGQAIARRLRDEGAQVFTAQRGQDAEFDGISADFADPDFPARVVAEVTDKTGRLDLLVNNISGDWHIEWVTPGYSTLPFWESSIDKGLAVQDQAVNSHIITSHYAARLMAPNRRGLIIEINDGNCLNYNCGLFYSFAKGSAVLLAYMMAEELKQHNVAAVSLTPGWLRSDVMLEGFGVSEANWRDVIQRHPDFEKSETPFYVGRAVAALATDANIMQRTGHALSAGYLAQEYGFTDVDGRQPPGYCPEGRFRDGVFERIR